MATLFPPTRYIHLQLTRVGDQAPRRKRRGGGRLPPRIPSEHGQQLAASVQGILSARATRRQPPGVDPALVLRVHLAPGSRVENTAWEHSGFTVLGSQPENVTLLFAGDQEMSEFRRRILAYTTRTDDQAHQHYPWLAAVESVAEWGPDDRRGRTLRTLPLADTPEVTLDIELWYAGDHMHSADRLQHLEQLIVSQAGLFLDRFIGQGFMLARVRVQRQTLEEVLTWDIVYSVDLPPRPQFSLSQTINLTISDFPPLHAPPPEAGSVCILDSGVAAGHPLLGPAVGETIAVPVSLGMAADVHGHGTMVGGLALYGDVQSRIEGRSFQPELWLFSARVTNERNEFEDVALIERQMQEAIEYFHRNYHCRVFNLSLGDWTRPFDGTRVSTWAATLDELARRLDVVIVVSSGNYRYLPDEETPRQDSPWAGYPEYLFGDHARILPPGEAANVLTVGALARPGTPYQSERYPNDVQLRPIARDYEPSPFTRSGPGVRGAIKPELCEVGGNLAINLTTGDRDSRDSGIACVSLNRDFISGRIFAFDSGTSFAAPRVAHQAARALAQFPDRSANLIRALLTSAARIPDETSRLLDKDGARIMRLCGYGRPDIEAALNSTDARVVLIAEEQLGADKFHVFEVPLPDEFLNIRGERRIGVALAFDPPTRQLRADYAGTMMDFRLVRGLDLDAVMRAFTVWSQDDGDEPQVPGRARCEMKPGSQARKAGTLQHAVHTILRNPQAIHGDTYYVVVRCSRGWASDEHYPQRYALVVTLEHTRPDVRLYEAVRLRARAIEEVRQRVRG